MSWKSSNTKVATVSETGKVTAKGPGTCKITATANDGSKKKATCTITVTEDEVSVSGLNYKLDHKAKTATVTGAAKTSVTSIRIPEAVKANKKNYKVTGIADKAFKGLKKLASVTIGKAVTAIGKNAFSSCANLKKIVIKTKLLKASTVGANAFKGVYSRVTVTCPKGMLKTYKALLLKKGLTKKAVFKE